MDEIHPRSPGKGDFQLSGKRNGTKDACAQIIHFRIIEIVKCYLRRITRYFLQSYCCLNSDSNSFTPHSLSLTCPLPLIILNIRIIH